ncbi:alginate lyase family protein [Paenibacillus azoreducens]|uniref:Heparin-sulfate lyase N-terminal domain-containing protein n=1 Tax=Paenibacillus azoreducens TaxID=116718 RepID=A0A920CTE2_9BACL|nr:alginate lyase family protein [Paenibacillus azoreducens]GIO49119.1 hypothetical protein J34TS1_38840 [Paenibacillus azoreducens]
MLTLQTKFRRLKKMPFRIAVKKVAGKAAEQAGFVYREYRIRRKPVSIPAELFRSFVPECAYLVNPADKDGYMKMLLTEGLDADIIRDADRICAHVFDLLGSGDTQLGPSLPWNEDFKSGYRWAKKFYKRIKIVDLDNAADVKVPWELSRFQHLFTLGKAYWLTGDEKYALEFRMQLEDWILQNPVGMSVNWTCAMDVAIRAANWIAAVPFFRESPSIPDAFWENFHASLYLHGRFIRGNLENTGEHTGNHYTADLAGLIALGLYFRGFHVPEDRMQGTGPAEWLAFGLSELEKEMFIQVHPDGTNYEASTSYHRLVAEMFLVTTIWCARNDLGFSAEYLRRLEAMFDFMLQIMKPDGLTPLIGDADDGRYLIVSQYGGWLRNDFRHLLAVAGEFFDRDDFRTAGLCAREDALWIAGGLKPFLQSAYSAMKSSAFPDGGYYVLRSPEVYCLIRCGELSFHGHGAHSHNDQLSFVLNIRGRDIAVDPGTYVYSADYRARNVFRSTAVHNTLQLGGMEQNDMEERNLFLLREQTNAACTRFADSHFAGRHEGYLAKGGIIHNRYITLEQASLIIIDTLEQTAAMTADVPSAAVSLMLAPEIHVSRDREKWLLHAEELTVTLEFEHAAKVELQEAWVSTSYGTRVPSKLLRVDIQSQILKTNIHFEANGGAIG